MGMKSNRLKRKKITPHLLAVKLPYLPVHGGNVYAGKELAPGFHIVFLRWKKEVPELQGLFQSKVLKQYHKRIAEKRVFSLLRLRGLLSRCFQIGSRYQTVSCVQGRSGQSHDQSSPK
jgi:hypothetical protein